MLLSISIRTKSLTHSLFTKFEKLLPLHNNKGKLIEYGVLDSNILNQTYLGTKFSCSHPFNFKNKNKIKLMDIKAILHDIHGSCDSLD